MRGRYLVRSPVTYAGIAAMDFALRAVPVRRANDMPKFRNILVANWAHVGDVVLTLPAVAALSAMFPDASMSMLAGSWALGAAEASGLFEQVFCIDHWLLNRRTLTRIQKIMQYWKMRAEVVRQLRQEEFDVAIDFYPFLPPAHPIFYAADVPVRIGFNSGGFGPLLTHSVRWRNAPQSMIESYADLVREIFGREGCERVPSWRYEKPDVPCRLRVDGLEPFVVVHPGAGVAFKEWGEANWTETVRRLTEIGYHVVVTGAGERESMLGERLAGFSDYVLNLVGKTDWRAFVSVVSHATAVICADSVAGHVAAMYEIPTISVFTGTNDIKQWGPMNPHSRVLLADMPCSPCNRGGCAFMRCIRDVSVNSVMTALRDVL